MIRALQMIFAPEGAWLKIEEKNQHFLFVLFISTLPLILGSVAVEAYGLHRLGEGVGDYGRINVIRQVIIQYAIVEVALDLAFLIGAAWFLLAVGRSFGAPMTFSRAAATLAYGSSSIFLMHALDGLPQLHTWLCWGVGAALAVRSLYHGVAVNLKPEQTKGMGLYIVSAFIVLFLGGLTHFVAITVLHTKKLWW